MKRQEDMFLEFPMTRDDMKNWGTSGTAVLQKNFATIVPEVTDRTGLLYTHNALASQNWIVDVTVSVGNLRRRPEGSEGFSIFYLKELAQRNVENIKFTYSKEFNGFGLIFDTFTKAGGMKFGENKVSKIIILIFTLIGLRHVE